MEISTQQEISLYEQLGGEPAIRDFVNRLYTFMDETKSVAHVRAMHSDDLSHARQRLFEFLSGWLGGPSLYEERHGHPRLRRRHMMFSIGDTERDQWMWCARKAIDGMDINSNDAQELYERLHHMASHLRNQPGSTGTDVLFRSSR